MSSFKNFELDYKSLKKSNQKNNDKKKKIYKASNSNYNPNSKYIYQKKSHNNKIYRKKNKYKEDIIKKIIAHTYYGLFFLGIVGFLFFLSISSGFAKSKNSEENNNITTEKHIKNSKNNNDTVRDTTYSNIKDTKNNKKDDPILKDSIIPIGFKKYRVKQHDTLSSIAKQYNINVDSIVLSNNLKREMLKIGSIILIPNQDGRLITLKATESIYTLAKKYNVKSEDIAFANDLRAEKIPFGTKVFIPLSKMSDDEREIFYEIEEIEINNKNNNESDIIKNKINNKVTESIEREFNVLQTWPLKGPITSHFGNREDPFNEKIKKLHEGIDIKNKRGTPVCAFRDGVVEEVIQDDPIYGKYIVLKHKNGYKSKYAHLNETMVEKGNNVRTTQVIGTVGSTGRSTGDHLHFEITKNSVFIDPLTILN